jgi:hypothetical protein
VSPKARPPKFSAFWKSLREELRRLVESSWREYRDAALKDGDAFFRRTREDLERWAALLARGQLTADEAAWLVRGKKDLATLAALEQAGLALAARDRFRDALLDVLGRSLQGLLP